MIMTKQEARISFAGRDQQKQEAKGRQCPSPMSPPSLLVERVVHNNDPTTQSLGFGWVNLFDFLGQGGNPCAFFWHFSG
jgi:hypothetical protein